MRAIAPTCRPLPAWRRWAAAWALVAVFGIALAPSISRWLAAAAPEGVAALCGTGAAGPSSNDPTGHPAGDAACALCVLAHAAPLLGAPGAPAVATPAAGHVFVAVVPPDRGAGTAPWRASARAPPALG
jgi:hypothetical protein